MRAPFNTAIVETSAPPIMEALGWLAQARPPEGREVLLFSQAAPLAPPPQALRAEIARAALEEAGAHGYGPVLGHPELRAEVAARWSADYGGNLSRDDVAITAGCNQAFCAAIATLAGPGDEVILPAPWYFNHRMWLRMTGIGCRALPCRAGMLPDPEEAAALIGPRTRAIVLVSPNNPTGAEYPPALLRAFFELARDRGLALVLDETYRDFRAGDGPAHDLFADPGWREVLVQLYSFSKAYRLAGHRLGAMVAAPERIAQAEKWLDTVTICPSQLGQAGALWGMRNLAGWLAAERQEILARRAATVAGITALEGWRLKGCGGYFAYVEHPFDAPSDVVARRLVEEAGVLLLPGTMFGPRRAEGGDGQAEAHLRIAFANADAAGLAELFTRLADFAPSDLRPRAA